VVALLTILAGKMVAANMSCELKRKLKHKIFKKMNYGRFKGWHKNLLVSQFASLGDILFIMPLVRKLQSRGFTCWWPIIEEYHSISRHFPDINFISTVGHQPPLDQRNFHECKFAHGKTGELPDVLDVEVIPFRWADLHTGDPVTCMPAKYTIMGEDWKQWRGLTWVRDREKERMLREWHGLKEDEPFNLSSVRFGCNTYGQKSIMVSVPNNGLRTIQISYVPGFTLLDWAGLIETATRIDFVSSSILYLIEVLNTQAELHIYPRRPVEQDFRYVEFLFTKQYIKHL
jgi:hypothetical protein